MGAGRTELLQSLFGMHPKHTTGSVAIDGVKQRIRCPAAAIRAGLALVPEDRKSEGVVLEMSVGENLTLASLNRVSTVGVLRTARESNVTAEYCRRLAIKTPSARQIIENLSGGNQQKVVLAKWLATRPKVLLLDEPTRGIDIGSKQEIYTLIRQLAADGLAVLMVSSELPEILALSDRILVLSEGKQTGCFSRGRADEDQLLHAALPTSKPQVVA